MDRYRRRYSTDMLPQADVATDQDSNLDSLVYGGYLKSQCPEIVDLFCSSMYSVSPWINQVKLSTRTLCALCNVHSCPNVKIGGFLQGKNLCPRSQRLRLHANLVVSPLTSWQSAIVLSAIRTSSSLGPFPLQQERMYVT